MFGLNFARAVPGAQRRGAVWTLAWDTPLLMGIVNVTPDSFSDGGRGVEASVQHALKLEREGARLLDIGGESTRPGATPVPLEQELARVIPVLRALRERSGALLSIDTRKPGVAHAALEAGAHLVNDIGGLRDPAMLEVCARHAVPAVLMHMQGDPSTMQRQPQYTDALLEVRDFLASQASRALEAGLPGVVLDPGIGFGKALEHNLALLRGLETLTTLPHPVLIGASRKSTIGRLTHAPEAAGRDPGSVALHLGSVARGAALLRVHDVAMHRQALEVWWAVWGQDAFLPPGPDLPPDP